MNHRHVHIHFLFDKSSSMYEDQCAAVQEGYKQFLEEHKFSPGGFVDISVSLFNTSLSHPVNAIDITNLPTFDYRSSGGTAIRLAMRTVVKKLKNKYRMQGYQNNPDVPDTVMLVVFTDGEDQPMDWASDGEQFVKDNQAFVDENTHVLLFTPCIPAGFWNPKLRRDTDGMNWGLKPKHVYICNLDEKSLKNVCAKASKELMEIRNR
jgi:uncharacterized protein YegL